MEFERERHAIVLGAGVAGLLAARVLTDFYGRVTVVDRDPLDGPPAGRRGVPQGGHSHDALARGHQIMEELFPGLGAELVAAGAPLGDIARDARWIVGGRTLSRSESGLTTVTCTRPFREYHLRRRLAALPGVELCGGTSVVRPAVDPERRAVTGVVVLRDGVERTLDADLVVDATGRGSRTPVWLEELGLPRVTEERHKIDIGYVTCFYRTQPEAFDGDISINTVASPEVPRGASCARVEGGRTVVTAYGVLGDHPPVDHEGFLDFVKSLQAPDAHEVLQEAELLTAPARYRFPTNLRRRYERLADFPAGLLVLGDAVASVNPRYGQGMTIAALEALVLRGHLAGTAGAPDGLGFFRELADQVIDDVWEMTLISDLSIPGVEGERTPEVLAAHEVVGRAQAAAAHDSTVALACLRLFGLIDPFTALLEPPVLERVGKVLAAAGGRPPGI
ncbi:FAD-dependent monooxygenase [Streptomyces sp. NPDC020875]|uniref:FAD-dependent oxidoreductase n=1 Tax=Streptomyces sp. NPDC020875 TaxID=3154898 RepID=UPI0033C1E4D6